MNNLYEKRKEWLNIFKDMRKKLVISNMKNIDKNGASQKCSNCQQILVRADIIKNSFQCPDCGNNLKIRAWDRIQMITDSGTFKEINGKLKTSNPINFPGYEEKIKYLTENLNMNEAVVTGEGMINNNKCILAVMDNHFLMGSMGAIVGEKVTRAIELATKKRLPIIIICTSGGARMQEGIISLMQMSKTSAALAYHNKEKLFFISVLTNPTTGGVTASFAMLGDIILAEPKALIGFAGPRVIEQTIKQKLPEGFQRAEFLQDAGFVDMIVERKNLKNTLGKLLAMHKEV